MSFLLLITPRIVWASELKVGIIGDQTGSSNLQNSYEIMNQGVSILKKSGINIVIHTGDLLESSLPDENIRKIYSQATGILNQAEVPWYLTAGDHDVNPLQYQPDSPDRSKEKLFQSLYSRQNPAVKEHLYYSFNKERYHFIALYSLEHLDTDPKWGNVFFSQISNAQYEWLHQDLEANKNKEAIIVFLHQPMWYIWSGWSRVHQLLSQYPVKAVIAGHSHYNQDEGLLDGIRYLVVGATGANIKTASPNAGGIHHVTLLSLKDGAATFTPLPVSPLIEKMTFSPRRDMDRIQAMEIVLGNLYNFSELNQVYLAGNRLANSCSSGEPAQLKLTGLGNPAEFPVEITVDFKSDSNLIKLVSAVFAPGACRPKPGERSQCTLSPSYRVNLANTSSVETGPGSGPIWTGTLGLDGPSLPPVGTNIYLTVSFSFIGSNQEKFVIYKQVSIQLQLCPNSP
jgi:predicted phosphodiesterase